MNWRKFENHAEETKAVKTALKAAGINAEVGHGKGTAWAWLEINVGKGPHDHSDNIGNHTGCSFCERRHEEIYKKAEHIALEVTGRHGDHGGEILVLTQDGWSKKQGSYAIEQAMDIEECKAHPELCRPLNKENDLHIVTGLRQDELNRTNTVNQSAKPRTPDIPHNTVRQPAAAVSEVKQNSPTNLTFPYSAHKDQKVETPQSEEKNTYAEQEGKFAYRIESRRVTDTDFPYEGQTIRHSKSAADFVNSVLRDADAEKMIVLYTNNQNKIIGVTYSSGTINATNVYPSQIAKTALLTGASGVIMVHNHPSGSLVPSIEDKRLTYSVITALNYIGLEVHDHIIYASPDKYYSMADDGLIAQYKQKSIENRRFAETVYERPEEEVKHSHHRHY